MAVWASYQRMEMDDTLRTFDKPPIFGQMHLIRAVIHNDGLDIVAALAKDRAEGLSE